MSERTITLREPIDSDFEQILPIMQDPVTSEVSKTFSRTRDEFRIQWDHRAASPACVVRTIVCEGKVVGRVNSFPKGNEVHVGYRIARSHWGQGIMSEVLARFLGLVEHRPLFARAAKSNIGSCRVLEKNGFVLIDEYDVAETDRGMACVECRFKLS